MSANQPPTPNTPSTPPLLSPREARVRADLYMKQRIDYQADYYLKRIDEFKFNADRMLMLSAFLMGISTLVSALTVLSNSAASALVTALLPAFAGGIAAFRSLYQWERQATIYESTWLALQRARIVMPDFRFDPHQRLSALFPGTGRSNRIRAAQRSQPVGPVAE